MKNYLADYSYFNSTAEMDKAAKQHEQKHWNAMIATDRAVLDMIRRHSVEFGAAHLKHDTIANATGKSNATIRRAIRKLEQLGIIDRIHYIRPVMNGLGANIYAIRPFQHQPYPDTNGDSLAPPHVPMPQPMEPAKGSFFHQLYFHLS